jgi:TRAP transporter TAXI family solute receptor
MATGAAGSGFASFGPIWGQSVRQMTSLPLAYRISGGSAANILLIEQDATQLGLTNLAVAAEAWTGRARWTSGIVLRGFRALFPIYDETLQIIAPPGQDIRLPADLGGTVVGIGPTGSTSATLVPPLLASLGITPSGFRTGDFTGQVTDVLAGRLAACAFMEVTPSPALAVMARHARFNLLGFTPAEAGALRKASPALTAMVIPPHSLPGQTAPVTTIGTTAIAICRAELPDGLAAILTRAMLRDGAITHRLATRPHHQWLAHDPYIAVHPGAVPALRRAGIAVPDRVAPNRRR